MMFFFSYILKDSLVIFHMKSVLWLFLCNWEKEKFCMKLRSQKAFSRLLLLFIKYLEKLWPFLLIMVFFFFFLQVQCCIQVLQLNVTKTSYLDAKLLAFLLYTLVERLAWKTMRMEVTVLSNRKFWNYFFKITQNTCTKNPIRTFTKYFFF